MLRVTLLVALLGASALPAAAAASGVREPGAAIPPMMFAGVSPSSAAPGQQVTITGLQFMPGARVWLGGQEAPQVQVETGERLIVTVPDHQPGKVSVMIRNPDGREVSRARSLTIEQR